MFLGKSPSAKDKIVSLFKDKKGNQNIHQLALSALLKNYLDQADALSLNVLNDRSEVQPFKILVIASTMYKRRAEWKKYQKVGLDAPHEINKKNGDNRFI